MFTFQRVTCLVSPWVAVEFLVAQNFRKHSFSFLLFYTTSNTSYNLCTSLLINDDFLIYSSWTCVTTKKWKYYLRIYWQVLQISEWCVESETRPRTVRPHSIIHVFCCSSSLIEYNTKQETARLRSKFWIDKKWISITDHKIVVDRHSQRTGVCNVYTHAMDEIFL